MAEVARAFLGGELQPLAPAHPDPAAQDPVHVFQFAAVVRTGFYLGWIVTMPTQDFFAFA